MSESKIELTLSLIPLLSVNEQTLDSDSVELDDWLEKSDEGLINFDTKINNEKEFGIENKALIDVLSQLSSTPNQQIYNTKTLAIKQFERGFVMLVGNRFVVLHSGDIIQLSGILLKVEIKQEYLIKPIPNEEGVIITPEIDDIWSGAQESAQHDNQFADPFSQQFDPLQRQSSACLNDPLGFLYHDPKSKHNKNILPLSKDSSTLNISTRTLYHPSSSVYPDEIFNPQEVGLNGKGEFSDGNVLNDLGIDEAGSTIVKRNYNSGKSSYQEQSPMDMLDEYLDEPDSIGYINNSYIHPHQNQSQNILHVRSRDFNQSFSASPSKRSRLSPACKKLLKVFTD